MKAVQVISGMLAELPQALPDERRDALLLSIDALECIQLYRYCEVTTQFILLNSERDPVYTPALFKLL